MRTIIVLTQTLKPLPDEALMTIKLFYYDKGMLSVSFRNFLIFKNFKTTASFFYQSHAFFPVTPADYEPPGFKPTEKYSFHFQEPMNIKMGNVSTVS